jgi:MFS family permease
MVIGILGYALTYLGMLAANSMAGFILVMIFAGTVEPLFRTGVDAMLIDIIPIEKRIDAYSVNRMGQNVGIALGPMVGGLLIAISYNLAMVGAAIAMMIFLVLILFGVKETISKRSSLRDGLNPKDLFDGYQRVFRDKKFMVSTLLITLAYVGFSQVWTLMQPYTSNVLSMSEALFAFLPMTNAVMVIVLQLPFTLLSKRFSLLRAMVLGCSVYMISIVSFSVAQNFWMVWFGFILLTCGEMFFVPASTTFAANLAPDDMRGRYMGLYSIYWSLASGIGPLIGAWINDGIGPRWIWIGAAIFPLIASIGYALMDRKEKKSPQLGGNFA